MEAMRIGVLILVAVGGLAVVLTREPLHQALVVGVYGLLLALLFFVFQDPDVALSQIVISTVALPLMILLTLAKVSSHEQGDPEERERRERRER
jgi:energy-converting hydrogenase B subunit D